MIRSFPSREDTNTAAEDRYCRCGTPCLQDKRKEPNKGNQATDGGVPPEGGWGLVVVELVTSWSARAVF